MLTHQAGVSPERIAEIERFCGGALSFALRDLQSGASVTHLPERKVKSASVIKLPILVHAALAAHEGALDWDEPLTLTPDTQCPGSGVLKSLTPGLRLSVRDACHLMIVLSDNTATNMVLDRVGVEPVNRRMRALGLLETTLFRRVYAPDTPAGAVYGLGVTTAHEMCELLSHIASGTLGPAAAVEVIRTMLDAQQDQGAIPRALPDGWVYAGKTGALSDVRNDVGIVTAPDGRRFVLALFCQGLRVRWNVDDPGLRALARLTALLLREHWT